MIRGILERSEETRANIYFGVCPRFGGGGKFDLAWQIRTVRTLWTDIDHCTVDEAQERLRDSELPAPSVIVNSGNGVHLYWLLDKPYRIDDAGKPLPVEKKWPEPNGKKKQPPRNYVTLDGERLFLDERADVSQLSPKALNFQDILAGIASKIGGDHTQDISRLLRLAGSLNRKNERNGNEPKSTELIECDPTRRYAISEFERFKVECKHSETAKQVAAMPLPTVRKPSPKKSDKLAELVAASSVAEKGARSEADFATCAYAIQSGIDRELVWSQVENVGKFAEGGQRYFDRTWAAAESKVRLQAFNKASGKTGKNTASPLEEIEEDLRIDASDIDAFETAGDFIRAEFTDGGNQTLWFWRDEFYAFDRYVYRKLQMPELRANGKPYVAASLRHSAPASAPKVSHSDRNVLLIDSISEKELSAISAGIQSATPPVLTTSDSIR